MPRQIGVGQSGVALISLALISVGRSHGVSSRQVVEVANT